MIVQEIVENNNNNVKKAFDTEVFNQIKRFLMYYRNNNTSNTINAYERDIRNFFLKTRNKDIEHLTRQDLIFNIDEFEDYYFYLLNERNVSVSTANRYITSISACFKHLKSRRLVEDISFLEIRKRKDEVNQYGHLTVEEVKKMAELAKNHGRSGETKRLLILFAADTRARLNECLNLTWDNFSVNKFNKDEIDVHMIGKGNKKVKQTISRKFYEELLTLKKDGQNKVFNIHRNTVNRMMDYLRKKMGFSEERNITFHSLKKAGVNFVYDDTKDIVLTSKAANHSDIKVTDRYLNKEKEYNIMGPISSTHGIDSNLFEKVGHKELLEAVRSLDKDKQMHINLQLHKLLGRMKFDK